MARSWVVHGLPVDAVHVLDVEEVAVQTPGLGEDLLPLLARIDHPVMFVVTAALFGVLLGAAHLPIATPPAARADLLAVARDLELKPRR